MQNIYKTILLLAVSCMVALTTQAQTTAPTQAEAVLLDSLRQAERMKQAAADSIRLMQPEQDTLKLADSVVVPKKVKVPRDWSTWRPDPKKALWLAMVIPGGGQIYNRKFWKLPIFYGGFVGCIYALRWNGQMYKDYSQAYLDIMDDNPQTESYNQFLHLGTKINASNMERYKQIFKSRKDKYRRWRDLSFFCLLGVYAVSIIDAYVDAEMSNFDISRDLSMKVRPTVMSTPTSSNPLVSSSVGVQCSLQF